MLSVAELWDTIRARNTVVPTCYEIVLARVIGGLGGPAFILPQQHYFAIVVNELFLEHSRQWFSEYDPVVLAITEFVYGGKTVTLPFVVGPKLLKPHVTIMPQGMIFRNTRIAGIHPFRGGRVIQTVVLCRSRRLNYALQLVKLVETISTAVPFGTELGTYTKLAESLLDGMDALLGVGETEPLVGLRQEFDHDLGNPIRPAFFALIDAPEKEVSSDRLWVRGGSLFVGDNQDALQPFRNASYVLFSIRGVTEVSDVDTLPFSGNAQSIIELAASADEDDWKRAKAELLVLYRELLNTPDLIYKQAQLYHDAIVRQAQLAQENAKRIGSLSISQETTARASQVQLKGEIEERLRHATSLLDLDRMVGSVGGDIVGRDKIGISDVNTGIQPGKAVPSSEKHISVWISECSKGVKQPLRVGQAYTLNFKVGQPVLSSLVSGPSTEVPSADIPETGLATEWAIISQSVELTPVSSDTSVTSSILGGSRTWTARFPLHIPREGDSPICQLIISPQTVPDAHLDVVVYARREIYRQFKIQLAIKEATEVQAADEAISIHDELLHAPAAHMNLQTPREWTTPPGELSIAVIGGPQAYVRGDAGADYIDQITQWSGVQAMVAGNIDNVRSAAERFRAHWEDYLNEVDPDDLARRLQQWKPTYDWTQLESLADVSHHQQWESEVRVSPELRDLAFDGHRLYETFFPNASDLRRWLDGLTPGHRLDISWLPTSGPGWIPHVPWGLMYLPDVPALGEPVDPLGFLALRFRLGYTAHAVQAGSKALGGLGETHRAYFLYWGDNPQDITGREARWQQQQWAAWENQVFIPAAQCLDRKLELLKLLSEPKPAPMGVLYLFCQCNTGDGNDPVLRFGSTSQVADMVRRTELGTKLLADRPFVFANACTTAATDPYIANELEQSFFARGCRAYLGTETKIPIQFASRFASIFFHFFYRIVDSAPMAAGEALAQTRLFLWAHYRNIGGLFYTHVNQYELFMARDPEILALRA